MREVRRWAVSRYAIGLDISVFISITIIDLFATIKISTPCIAIWPRIRAFRRSQRCALSFRQMPDGDLINLSLSCFILFIQQDTVKGNFILQCRSTRHFNSVNISPQLNERVVVGRLDYKLWIFVTVLYSTPHHQQYFIITALRSNSSRGQTDRQSLGMIRNWDAEIIPVSYAQLIELPLPYFPPSHPSTHYCSNNNDSRRRLHFFTTQRN